MKVVVEELRGPSVARQRTEMVERKGLGHPDSICDAIMEESSLALVKEYRSKFGTILHHNLDKALLIGGSTENRFGGGKILKPMRLIFGDRATFSADDRSIDVHGIIIQTAKDWFRRNFRFVDPEEHVTYQSELKQGSVELTNLFQKRKGFLGANDTSAGVGFAPLSQTESIVLETELYLNSREFKDHFPYTGEDVKIMGVRTDRQLHLTLAMPLIDRFIRNEKSYFEKKRLLTKNVEQFVSSRAADFTKIDLAWNVLDKKNHGMEGLYLSVIGTSAENADSGQVGRGNRVSGLISFNRPASLEAAAGKNAISHVGKIYNVLANKLAHQIYESIEGIEEVYVLLVSEIGVSIDRPAVAAIKILTEKKKNFAALSGRVRSLVREEFKSLNVFIEKLLDGEYSVI
jgi:S-adenosylmethionine synthetase